MKQVDLKTVQVSIKRDDMTIVDEVFEHEVPILKAIHFPENVQVIDKDLGELELPDDAEFEYRRLQGKYDNKNIVVVARIYRDAKELAKDTGLTLQDHATEQASEATIKANRPEKKSAKKADK